ncbi:MAG: ATP-binding protein [Actinomycetota bacterium]
MTGTPRPWPPIMRRRLRLTRNRGTTAQVASAYPFQAAAGLGERGVYLGTNVLAGGCGFAFCPFDAYGDGLVTNPNMLVAGEPGTGKSAAVKAFVHRSVGVFGRWVAIADPKGEYRRLAEALGLEVVRLHPGGRDRLNPLDGTATGDTAHESGRRQAEMAAALVATVLRRGLSPVEDAALGWAVGHLAARPGGSGADQPTLAHLAGVLADPPAELAERARTTPVDLARRVEAVTWGIGKLLDRQLRGMFDGPTTVRLDRDGRGVVLDLSAVHHDPDALALVMVAATAWLQSVLAAPDGPPRLQVLDEAWSLLASERTSRYLQSCWKLGRAYGVANVAVVHRLSDLRSQADDGTATAKVGMGLLADTQTRVLFRQSSDQVDDARVLLGLTGPETRLLPLLARGRALWKVGGNGTAVVAHHLARAEEILVDTDARMAANPGGFTPTDGVAARNPGVEGDAHRSKGASS